VLIYTHDELDVPWSWYFHLGMMGIQKFEKMLELNMVTKWPQSRSHKSAMHPYCGHFKEYRYAHFGHAIDNKMPHSVY
jgi:hypothetical protein